jgi:PUA domain protein
VSDRYRRYFLKSKEADLLLDEALKKLKVDFRQMFKTEVNVELIEAEFAKIYLTNGRPFLAKARDKVFPTLAFSKFLASAPRVVVDMGAVSHVCNGANVMAPGIRRFEGEFRKGDFVAIVDEKHGKPIAVGEIMYDAQQVENVKQGVIVQNVHFVGDKTWNFLKKFEAATPRERT